MMAILLLSSRRHTCYFPGEEESFCFDHIRDGSSISSGAPVSVLLSSLAIPPVFGGPLKKLLSRK
jgi:hypothetical protein